MPIFLEFFVFLMLFFLFAVLLNPLFWFFMFIFFPIILLLVFYFISFEALLIALMNLIVIPKQLIHMFKNPVLRKNHALEHATINVLEERYGPLKDVGGYAEIDGFYIMSGGTFLTAEEIYMAAQEGLSRLKAGERDLAVHKRCGTSITVTNLLISVLFVVILLFGGWFSLLHLLIALGLAFLVSHPLGELAQKYITTDPEVSGMRIKGVYFDPFSRRLGLPIPLPQQRYFVETEWIKRARRIW